MKKNLLSADFYSDCFNVAKSEQIFMTLEKGDVMVVVLHRSSDLLKKSFSFLNLVGVEDLLKSCWGNVSIN